MVFLEAKEIRLEGSSRVSVRDVVTNADSNQEDSEDFVFTSASDQGNSDRFSSLNRVKFSILLAEEL